MKRWRVFIVLLGMGILVATGWRQLFPSKSAVGLYANAQESRPVGTPAVLDELLALPPSELEQCDIALMDLLCAQGLPGAEGLNVTNSLSILDDWARHVRVETERNFYRFQASPADFYHSEGYFRMLMMAVVMYEDFGIRYNPARIVMPGRTDPHDHFFADAHDVFIHGLLGDRRMGTCSSMPVLYIAIGRRLDYPLKLVTTKAHLFVRWESDKDRFNVEATGKGMNRYDDEHFKQWPFPVSEAEIQTEGFLRSLSASEELAVFLSLRGNCLKEAGQQLAAAECYANAARLAPTWNAYRALLADVITASSSAQSYSGGAVVPQPSRPAAWEMPVQTVAGPDPNPLKQMNRQ